MLTSCASIPTISIEHIHHLDDLLDKHSTKETERNVERQRFLPIPQQTGDQLWDFVFTMVKQ